MKRRVGRIARGVARRLPGPVKGALRRIQGAPLGAKPQTAPAAPAKPAALRVSPAFARHVQPEMVGGTYTPAETTTFLSLENAYLKSRLDKAEAALAAVERSADGAQPAGEPSGDGGRSAVVPSPAGAQKPAGAGTPTTAAPVEDAAPEATPRELVHAYLKPASTGASGVAPRPRHLVVANEYPDVGREYGNGFVHRRIKHYQDAGVDVDVAIVGPRLERRVYEYDGVRILSGRGPELSMLLEETDFHSVSVHFLNEDVWRALEPGLDRQPVHLFLHGYECCRWIRRIHNFPTGGHLERAIERSMGMQRFWQGIVGHRHSPETYFFVSDWLRRAASDDMEVAFPASRSRVVHNIVDTSLFNYVEKDAGQRFNILWVRSADNLNYGHDIAIACLKRLSASPRWSEVRVTIVGDGRHFEDFDRELGSFPNVEIRRGFVSQEQVAALHKDHGVLLVPTRLDSQGVSRDEAMASGLVPATNLVAAIPEFVDDECAVLAPAEDAGTLAEGIERLLEDPELFLRMSRTAAERVSTQSGIRQTVARELARMGLATEPESEPA